MSVNEKQIPKIGFFNSLGTSASYSFDLIVASAIINIAGLAIPLTVMQVYDRIIPYQAIGSLSWLALGCCIAVFFETLLRMIREKMGSWLSVRYEYQVSNQCFKNVLEAPLEQTDKEDLNSLIDKLNAINIISTSYCKKMLISIIDFPFAFLYLGIVWIIFPKISYFLLGVIFMMTLITLIFRPILKYLHLQQRSSTNACMNFIINSIKKVHFIKSFSLEERMIRSFEQKQLALSKDDFYASIGKNFPSDFQAMIGQLTILGCLIVGAPEVIERATTIGVLVTSMLLSSRAIQSFQTLGSHWIKYGEIETAKEKVNSLISLPNKGEIRNIQMDRIKGNLIIKGLCYYYGLRKDDTCLGVNLNIGENEFVVLNGSNFILISVLAEIICGLRKPPIGHIMLDDFNLEYSNRENLKGIIEFVPLNAPLLPGTILDNIARFNPEHRLTAQQLADNLGLNEWAAKLPRGLYTHVDRKSIATLSSSFIQLISITRALVINPKVLVIDHIESDLDELGRSFFSSIIEQLRGQMTLILISNDPNTIKLADKVYRIEKNKISLKLNKK